MNYPWQATVQDDQGSAVVNPVVTVWEADGVTLATIYDVTGAEIANPIAGSLEGFVQFWASEGEYRIEGESGGEETEVWSWIAGVDLSGVDSEIAQIESDISDINDSIDVLEGAISGLNSAIGPAVTVSSEVVPANVQFITTSGYHEDADGGAAVYVRASSEPSHPGKLQSADGSWWEMRPSFGVSIRQFGAKPNGLLAAGVRTDNRIYIQNAVDFCLMSGLATEIRIPSGNYYYSGTVAVNLPDKTAKIAYRSVNFVGEGAHTCELITDNPNGTYAINVTGPSDMSNLNLGGVQDLHWRDFRARPATAGVGDFLVGRGLGHSKFECVLSFEYHYHYQIQDTLCFTFDRCRMSWGTRGVWMYRNNFTYPNVIVFLNSTIGSMYEIGGVFEGAAGVTFVGGSIEGNGIGGGANSGGIRLVSPGPEGGVALDLSGTYFEYNHGVFDVNIISNQYFPTRSNIAGVFNRGGDSGNAIHSIYIQTEAGHAPVVVDYSGSAFSDYSGYVPSSSRVRVNISGAGPVIAHGSATFANQTEAPFVTDGTPHAAIRLGPSGATLGSMNISSVFRNGVGDYTLTYGVPSRNPVPTVRGQAAGSVAIPMVSTSGATGCRVMFYGVSGSPVDPSGYVEITVGK